MLHSQYVSLPFLHPAVEHVPTLLAEGVVENYRTRTQGYVVQPEGSEPIVACQLAFRVVREFGRPLTTFKSSQEFLNAIYYALKGIY